MESCRKLLVVEEVTGYRILIEVGQINLLSLIAICNTASPRLTVSWYSRPSIRNIFLILLTERAAAGCPG